MVGYPHMLSLSNRGRIVVRRVAELGKVVYLCCPKALTLTNWEILGHITASNFLLAKGVSNVRARFNLF